MSNGSRSTGETKVRILVADRYTAVRSAVKALLQNELGLDVIGEACDSLELLAQIEAQHPDVVLLEWELPGQPAAELLAILRALDPQQLKIIVLGSYPDQHQDALAAGADYFVSKSDRPKRLLTAVRVIQVEGG
jgi:DNA-binding NarL/FixJ family response regulator